MRKPELTAELQWTFPLAFAEIISGDGQQGLSRADRPDRHGRLRQPDAVASPQAAGRRWVRFEVWDIAANGAFTQPVWIE